MQHTVFFLLTGIAALAATTALAGPLITPAELAATETGQSPVILDIRGKAFDQGHIAGAVSAPYALFRGPATNPGAVPPVDQLESTYESLGLDPARPVVIVAQGDTDSDFGAAARVYWTLKSSGFTDLAVLNGGATAWVNAGLPLSDTATAPVPTDIAITWNDTWTADIATVNRVIDGSAEGRLIDARPTAFFEGKQKHDAAASPGTLPGARSLPHSSFFRPGATAINAEVDAGLLGDVQGLGADAVVVSFCNTGHWAATDWFAMSEVAGIDNVKLYPGSMVEYSQTGAAMDNQPGLFTNLLGQLTGKN